VRRPARLVLLGHPVGHSLSPRIHAAALEAAGIAIPYEAVDVLPGQFDDMVASFRAAENGVAGNVTIPYKERFAERCDRLTPLAARVGAVNVFWMEEGAIVGDNTDVGGFAWAVQTLLGEAPANLQVGVLGAGGGAAAVLAAVERWPDCNAIVYNRSAARAEALCARFGNIARAVDDASQIGASQLVVNATSIGLRDDSFPIEISALDPRAAVFDLVYRPGETAWVRAARAAQEGRRASDGLPMLLEQAALAFERWFGLPPDRRVMWGSVL
jgi:shikimate dehydrogenase